MSEVYRIDGELYESLKSGASRTGYTADYIGQLSREGHIQMRRIGRKVYVNSTDLAKYSSEKLQNSTKPRSFDAVESIETVRPGMGLIAFQFERLIQRLSSILELLVRVYQSSVENTTKGVKNLISRIDKYDWIVQFWHRKSGALLLSVLATLVVVGVVSSFIEERIIYTISDTNIEMKRETLASPLRIVESLRFSE